MSNKNNSKKDKPKKDTSPFVYQRDKLRDGLTIKDLEWTEKQKSFIELASDKNIKLIMVKGPAGCSKTVLSTYCALKLLSEKKCLILLTFVRLWSLPTLVSVFAWQR